MAKVKMTAGEKRRLLIKLEAEAQARFFEKKFGIKLVKSSNRFMQVTKIENDDLVFFGTLGAALKPQNWPENIPVIDDNKVVRAHVYLNLDNWPAEGWVFKFKREDLTEEQYKVLQDLAVGDDDFTWFKNVKSFGYFAEIKIMPGYKLDEERAAKVAKMENKIKKTNEK